VSESNPASSPAAKEAAGASAGAVSSGPLLARLGPLDQEHLQRLLGTWGILADLCYSDLLLCIPEEFSSPEEAVFWVVGQVRPTTSQTVVLEDLVGSRLQGEDASILARAYALGEIVIDERMAHGGTEPARLQAIPVRRDGKVIAVLLREWPIAVGRRLGQLERTYLDLFGRFAGMLTYGSFPYPPAGPTDDMERIIEDAPRVGDGGIVLDEMGRVVFASPNALSALHRLGVRANVIGTSLGELGVDDGSIQAAFRERRPRVGEIESANGAVVLLRCLPVVELDKVTGALVLCRDVTDLRLRDRLLLSKDATIKEIHHRVKNNLQTVSSLLRLAARRAPEDHARLALVEADRRIRSIAVVHDFLSREVGDHVGFAQIAKALVRLAEESLPPGLEVTFKIEGDAGAVPAGLATPLAVVVSELLQNAVKHAFQGRSRGEVRVLLERRADSLVVSVADDGRGLPDGFRLEEAGSLGLLIVRDLVEGQLGGKLELRSGRPGLEVRLELPRPSSGDS